VVLAGATVLRADKRGNIDPQSEVWTLFINAGNHSILDGFLRDWPLPVRRHFEEAPARIRLSSCKTLGIVPRTFTSTVKKTGEKHFCLGQNQQKAQEIQWLEKSVLTSGDTLRF
jgi:hypothetical protein